MFGLDNPSGVSVMPPITPVSNPTPLWFTDGGAGLAVSYPGQEWFNIVQAELLAVLQEAGIKPDKSKLNQLAVAIKSIAAERGIELTDKLGNSSTLAASQKLVTEINDNANNKLAKNQNGADIPNKSEFIKNLGLSETVNLAQGAVPGSRKVNGKALTGDISLSAGDVGAFKLGLTGTYSVDNQVPWNANTGLYDLPNTGIDSSHVAHFYNAAGSCPAFQLNVQYRNGGIAYRSARESYGFEEDWTDIYTTRNKPTAADIQAEPRHTTTIDLTGLSTERYYPVWWCHPPNIGANSWLTLHRYYPYDAEKKPFGEGVTHVAGLLVQMEGGDTPWGGDAHYLNIKRINQTYRKTVRAIRHGMISIARPVDGKYPLYGNVKSGEIVGCYVYSGCYLRGGLTYFVTSNFQPIHYSREEGEVEMSRWSDTSINREITWMVKSFAASDTSLGEEYADATIPYSLEYDSRYQKKL
ncbi:tail fiber protein [Photorhabdus temperata]|uniref:Phage tail fiber n=1 Tax=Photorhabdus temperata subsp. temperata Meg1 TaxID=1393735 RepID=A0A081RR88_PHOTE|nr:tail fiber protein [Photorhabdus temperata]KER01191.1 Phage tail fiber [Photorhabdus temperata subsp. temperata Meg1]